jgi:hypothetical protein
LSGFVGYQTEIGLFVTMGARAAIQDIAGAVEYTVGSDLRVGWRFKMAGIWQLKPWVRVFYDHLSLVRVPTGLGDEVDGLIHTQVMADHYRGLATGLTMSVRPFYELLIRLKTALITNPDFNPAAPDRVDLGLGFDIGLPGAVLEPFTGLSVRFRDADRSTTFVRFHIGLQGSYMLGFSAGWAAFFRARAGWIPQLNTYFAGVGLDFLYYRDRGGFSPQGWVFPMNGFYGLHGSPAEVVW